MICSAANALWLTGCLPEAGRFRRATLRVREEQEHVLRSLLRANAATEFGRQHDFSAIRTASEYQHRVPPRTYDDYRPWIDRVAEGAANALTREPVRMLEPTSGSAGSAKLIPYTDSLQQEFQRGIRAWVADLFLHQPELMSGTAYWSVSPAVASSRRTAGGIPIGFDDDSCYVGGWQQRLVRSVMAVPSTVRHIRDMDRFRYETLLSLVASSSLRLVSVWNPTFLSLLVDRLPEWGDALLRDLHSTPDRARALRAALRARTPGERHTLLWPRLRVISCWTDANADGPAAHLSTLFPQARIQGKGLIATEGFVSFPLTGRDGAALAVRSHFLEFEPVDTADRACDSSPRLAHQLERGQRYAVILSTSGGLYRYRLQDVVEVVGHLHECPLIRFRGRQGHFSDWYGEKLDEAYVSRALRDALDASGLAPRFAMIACDNTTASPAYVLYIDTAGRDDSLIRVAQRLEAQLCCAFHYGYARRLGQLGPLRVFRAEDAASAYLNTALSAGQRAGDVKPLALDRRDRWSTILRGRFVA